jgi:NAD+ synthase
MTTIDKIMDLNRHPELSDWFRNKLIELIGFGVYHNNIPQLRSRLVSGIAEYCAQHQTHNVVIGMSGGIDSALTAALFREAGCNVYGVTLPIHQNPDETARGVEACEALGIQHINVDLTNQYDFVVTDMLSNLSDTSLHNEDKASAVRRGNVRARLRMITLYNLAGKYKGFVASTDNFSELAAGFWTLHGDVGDVAPIQSLTKSWEVPALAELVGVPESTVKAVPTDGLGIANGDEDQFGFSYLHFDIGLFTLMRRGSVASAKAEDKAILDAIAGRIQGSTYKRANPFNLYHPFDQTRYENLKELDYKLRSEQ